MTLDCPKNNLILRIHKTRASHTVYEVDATVSVWFICPTYLLKNPTYFIASVTGTSFYAEIHIIFGTVYSYSYLYYGQYSSHLQKEQTRKTVHPKLVLYSFCKGLLTRVFVLYSVTDHYVLSSITSVKHIFKYCCYIKYIHLCRFFCKQCKCGLAKHHLLCSFHTIVYVVCVADEN